MRLNYFFFLLAIGLIGSSATAQRTTDPLAVCTVEGCREVSLPKPRYSDANAFSVQQVWTVVNEILAVSGLLPNFQVVATEEVGNAAAVVIDGERYLAFNPDWLAEYKSDPNARWQLYGVMAHEVGHHLQGHTITGNGSRPPTELEADEYAGFVLAAMGATLKEAQSLWATLPKEGSVTHPPQHQRFAAVERGWLRRGGGENKPVAENGQASENAPASGWTKADHEQALEQCQFNPDPNVRVKDCNALIENATDTQLIREVYILKAQAQRQTGDPESALFSLLEAENLGADIGPSRGWLFFFKGKVFADLDRHPEAADAFEIALTESDGNAKILIGLANAQTALGQTDQAAYNYRSVALDLGNVLEDRLEAQEGYNALNPGKLPLIAPDLLVANFYDIGPDELATDLSLAGIFSENPYISDSLRRMLLSDEFREYPMLDFDPIIWGQDAEIANVSIDGYSREYSDTRFAYVNASFTNFGTPIKVRFSFGVHDGIWKLENVESDEYDLWDMLYEAGPVAIPPENPAPMMACDRLTAHPDDVAAVSPGVSFNQIDAFSAIEQCRQAAERFPEEVRFVYQLGRAYDKAGQFEQALAHYRDGARRGHLQSMASLAILHENGEGTYKDECAAAEWSEIAANEGHVKSMYNVAVTYRDGFCESPDNRQAFKFFSWAAQQGHAKAANSTGFAYAKASGVDQDFEQARNWYLVAADGGNLSGMRNAALYLDRGKGGSRDPAEAAWLLLRAVEAGHDSLLDELRDGSLNLQVDTIAEIQKILRGKGVYGGPIDGKAGPMTHQAILALAPF